MAVARGYSMSMDQPLPPKNYGPADPPLPMLANSRRRLAAPARRLSLRRRLALVFFGLLGLSLLALAALALIPPPTGDLVSRPRPAASYAEALARIAALQAQEATGYNPLCATQFLTHQADKYTPTAGPNSAHDALTDLCQALLASSEFVYRP